MPARKHLTWTEIREFGGLWTAGAQTLMPADRSQTMSGCHPQPGGGLRAFHKVTATIPNTGMTALGSDELANGFGLLVRGPIADDIAADVVLMLVTVGTSGEPFFDDWKVWRWEADKGATSWAMSTALGVTTFVLTNPARQAQFAYLQVGSATLGVRNVFVALFTQENPVTVTGLHEFDPDTGTLTRIDATDYGGQGVVRHQSRLLTGHSDSIQFTAPGTDTFATTGGLDPLTDPPADPAAGFIRPNTSGGFMGAGSTDGSEDSTVVWMLPIPPGDFLVATRDGQVYNIQGDLQDPIVRELARLNAAIPHEPVAAPSGVYVIEPNKGVSRISMDGSVELSSVGILPSIWTLRTPRTGLGQLAATGKYVFAPNQHDSADHRNGALVYDTELNAWFTSTHEDEHAILNPRFMMASPNYRESGVWVVPEVAPGDLADDADYLFHIQTGSSDDIDANEAEARNSIWEWKSAPLRDPAGRYVDVRQVRIPVYAWNASSELTVTVGATTSVFPLPAGRSIVTMPCRVRAELVDVTLYADAGNSTDEAPMVEAVQIGWKDGPLL